MNTLTKMSHCNQVVSAISVLLEYVFLVYANVCSMNVCAIKMTVLFFLFYYMQTIEKHSHFAWTTTVCTEK